MSRDRQSPNHPFFNGLLGVAALLSSQLQAQSVIFYHNGQDGGGSLGSTVSGVGDVNLDGFPDLMANAPFWDADPDGTPMSGDELSNVGRVFVYSGKNGTTLWSRDGEGANDQFGTSISGAGDVNEDGLADIVVGARGWDLDPDGTPANGDEVFDLGRVYMCSGQDGAILWLKTGAAGYG